MHRQADDFRSQPLAHRDATLAYWKMFIGLLAMQRDRIIDRGRNAFCFERRGKCIAAATGDADGVLRPDRCGARRHGRHGRDVAKRVAIAPGDLVAVAATGAYCYSLSSRYNLIGRPAVVAVRDGQTRLILRRETIDDLLSLEVR